MSQQESGELRSALIDIESTPEGVDTPILATPSEINSEVNEEILNCETQKLRIISGIDLQAGPSNLTENTKALETNGLHEPTLIGMPWDVREQIFKYLLHNPVLETPDSIQQSGEQYGAHQDYSLDPAILRTCRKFYEEGTHVLYGSHKFYVACIGATRNCGPICALRRYTKLNMWQSPMWEVPFLQHVKKWRVVVSTLRRSINRSKIEFLEFCRALCNKNIESLEIRVIEKGIQSKFVKDTEYGDIADLLQPLKLLRQLPQGALIIRNADGLLPNCTRDLFYGAPNHDWGVDGVADELKADIMQVAGGTSPVELVVEMYHKLLRYCQAFEYNPIFRAEMALPDGTNADWKSLGYDCSETPRWHRYTNPYRETYEGHSAIHPVEDGLWEARRAVILYDSIEDFKIARATILEYLERQYQRISNAAANIVQFVNEQKGRHGMFYKIPSSERWCIWTCMRDLDKDREVAAFSLIQEYAAALERERPLAIRAKFVQHKKFIRRLQQDLPRTKLLKELQDTIEVGDVSTDIIKRVIDHLDDQLIEIRLARKELFRWDVDLESRGVNIHPADPACAEHISWDLPEPDMCPEFDPSKRYQRISGC